jgi:hypothetical protein
MGDRGNIVIRQGEHPPVVLYTHWSGYALPGTLGAALAKRQRWDDNPYLARIIFDTLTAGQQGQETGFGITTYLADNQYPILEVDPDTETVRVWREPEWLLQTEPERRFTFEEFVALGPDVTWETIDPDEEAH